MKTLAIDTSTYTLSIGLADGDVILAEQVTNVKKNHSIRVMPAIQTLMNEADIKPEDLEKIIVTNGPGSYTGVRIGVTIAKTLAWTLNIPLAAVSGLASLAASAPVVDGLVCPVFDARRGRIFTGLYRLSNGAVQPVLEDRNVSVAEWCTELLLQKEPVLFVGQESKIHEKVIAEQMGEQAVFAGRAVPYTRPAALLALGAAVESNPTEVVPNYARLAEAEAKWIEANEKKAAGRE
ncbi:tRNA (adenosine(37)-N6)-threonylcarbamoyltransferase complex dimerization subunit type 1 TsaB [Domibacillus sp. DTU_2020_1001157_1_SI_ALB_TIR_016]|uniref:tRNA (adenosine(37)-N6)-threonylcarbamoyltransferase complex dimerization subunit type 1 TsaB n=1 Tax=Domibacillus sp. DTU_2020_1001157_1_SI_ALB_TIR_016 TaxID=3077789 RepID=UPI0028E18EFE|nr:tRNA (adenosine(37)-N6)-threonylcarbamoyltransferase complex dimerization subunit type 1 TsaB [Domibacillus sp. DTU_2020_1001157_1_SI_ALB_TIR_016]WNS80388.1 tRNA (adenosine(37)-N6)-threonylcarbamoyltransferase complex dimerization subunit type 1 TsaB [Domibacillus sp. DTU_2020_1001157_1_SI_ALB_TIR_016]